MTKNHTRIGDKKCRNEFINRSKTALFHMGGRESNRPSPWPDSSALLWTRMICNAIYNLQSLMRNSLKTGEEAEMP